MLRRLLVRGYRAEIVCQEEAFCKASVWYGEWIIRAVSSDETSEKILCTTPRGSEKAGDIRFRVFKTINGLASFMHRLGFAHIDVPFHVGGRASHVLPLELVEAEKGKYRTDDDEDGGDS